MLKKLILPMILVILVVGIVLFKHFNVNDNKLKKVKVAEVTHSIFYAPQYVAHALGYFEEEGLDVEIGFCGSEATIYVYNNGEKDYLVTFAGLTKRDGSFIVSREKYDNFTLNNLKGKTIIGGRIGYLN